MGNMVTNVYAKANYDRLRIDKDLGFRKSDKKKKNNNNNVAVRIRFPGPNSLRSIIKCIRASFRSCDDKVEPPEKRSLSITSQILITSVKNCMA